MNSEFKRINRLTPYVFNEMNTLKAEARARDVTHRYPLSRGIPRLRQAICNWYQ